LTIAVAALLLASAGMAQAQDVYPRVYTAEDCTEMMSQLDQSVANTRLPPGTGIYNSVAAKRARAEQACARGDFATGARTLRAALDEIITARMSVQ